MASTSTSTSSSCWLMKAEPETRLEKGKDVAFSISHLESSPNQTTTWDGVRNHQAKKFMMSMKLNDSVLFYHSNCKIPGVAGLAFISKESYPDPSAWDTNHPYFDPKTKQDSPTWYCVSVRFKEKFETLVPLELLKMIGSGGISKEMRGDLEKVLTKEMVDAIGEMALIKSGRLSVQPCPSLAYQAVQLLSSNSSIWQAWPGKWNTTTGSKQNSKAKAEGSVKGEKKIEGTKSEDNSGTRKSGRNKRKVQVDEDEEAKEKVKPKKGRTSKK